uniref:Uncharacterized protein n=1 Tax=Arundo donax TaxID=35708 RepID=A0A0A9EC25_ARUDO
MFESKMINLSNTMTYNVVPHVNSVHRATRRKEVATGQTSKVLQLARANVRKRRTLMLII